MMAWNGFMQEQAFVPGDVVSLHIGNRNGEDSGARAVERTIEPLRTGRRFSEGLGASYFERCLWREAEQPRQRGLHLAVNRMEVIDHLPRLRERRQFLSGPHMLEEGFHVSLESHGLPNFGHFVEQPRDLTLAELVNLFGAHLRGSEKFDLRPVKRRAVWNRSNASRLSAHRQILIRQKFFQFTERRDDLLLDH